MLFQALGKIRASIKTTIFLMTYDNHNQITCNYRKQ